MKYSLALSTLLLAGPILASPCRPKSVSSSSSAAVVAVSSSASAAPSSRVSSSPVPSSAAPSSSGILSTPASSSSALPSVVLPSSSSSAPPVVIPSSSAAPSSEPTPSSSSAIASHSASASSSSSAALPSSSGGLTTNPGQPSCSTDNLFVDSDFSLGISYWPSNVLTGAPTCSLGANCGSSPTGAAYAQCLELDLVTLGQAEGLAFHQQVAVVKGTAYKGYFHYRLSSLGVYGKSMVTLTCTVNGEVKYNRVLCDTEVSQAYRTVDFTYTADCTEATFQCQATTSGVTAQLQFADFYLGEQC
ncbi:hypothetical protein SPBR_06115 [Sporothrix brasiliensis 5110]|uniref:CBM-cenC domain-containing protein n=1 Tax=Sporothrix brasiliensis 5110 TaxID=1398154 RepID=A0A0C2FT94_9PEZI|nr:uncharacterized protein SPBR_06115 [Sporothrix brasiliensis 5110]KIH94233.1 hypothetical protein SPBR_06115 [Sporothrix brasiliensis 5110]